MKLFLLLGWLSKSGEDDFSGKTDAGIKGTKGNANFTTLAGQVTTIEAAYAAYLIAKADAAQGGKENTAARNARRVELVVPLRSLISNINAICQGDEEKLLSSAFPMSKTSRTPSASYRRRRLRCFGREKTPAR